MCRSEPDDLTMTRYDPFLTPAIMLTPVYYDRLRLFPELIKVDASLAGVRIAGVILSARISQVAALQQFGCLSISLVPLNWNLIFYPKIISANLSVFLNCPLNLL